MLNRQDELCAFPWESKGGLPKPLALSKLFLKVLYTHPQHFGKHEHDINTAYVTTFVQDKQIYIALVFNPTQAVFPPERKEEMRESLMT